MKIKEVIRRTGLSREIIHHYLRQGLLPRSNRRGDYDQRQVRLLHLIKKLREDRHLGLDVIHRLFEAYDFDPVRMEMLIQSDSLGKRMKHLVTEGSLVTTGMLSAEELVAKAGITSQRLSEYVEKKLVIPVGNGGQERFYHYHLNVISLCERGIELGIPLDTFRTIASYVQVAFGLENRILQDVLENVQGSQKEILGELFVRQEMVVGFIQNLLQALIAQWVSDSLASDQESPANLDHVIYRPSHNFTRRYGIDRRIDSIQQALVDAPDKEQQWREAARLMIHAGRYSEAVFQMEQALQRWPGQEASRELYGRALLLSGQSERGIQELEDLERSSRIGALSRAFLALATLAQDASRCARHVDRAIAYARDASWADRSETLMLAGWLLVVLPPAFRDEQRGLQLLLESYQELEKTRPAPTDLPGAAERRRLNCAYLLHDCLKSSTKPDAGLPTPEDLRALICRLDPGCDFAQNVFLFEGVDS